MYDDSYGGCVHDSSESTFEIQDFTYVYLFNEEGKVEVRSFNPIKPLPNYYVTQEFPAGTTIVYEGVQLVKDGMQLRQTPFRLKM